MELTELVQGCVGTLAGKGGTTVNSWREAKTKIGSKCEACYNGEVNFSAILDHTANYEHHIIESNVILLL